MKQLLITSSPHIHSRYTIDKAMREILLALLPAVLAAVYFFRLNAALVILISVLAALAAEYACQKLMGRPVTIFDGSAALTGLLLALCLPPALPLWTAALGSVFAIVIGKQVFGGLGCNVFNPAHIGRAILLTSMPVQMTFWTAPLNTDAISVATQSAGKTDAVSSATRLAGQMDAVSSATPLAQSRALEYASSPEAFSTITDALPNLFDMFIGNISGSLGETCAPALLMGGLFLIWRGHIDWRIPVYYIGSVFLIMSAYATARGYGMWYPVYQVLAGGLLIGAFFMATDWVTSPLTAKGRIIFALGLGLLTCLLRLKSGYVEGVCYSILIMNMLTPLIDRYTRRRVFGRDK